MYNILEDPSELWQHIIL